MIHHVVYISLAYHHHYHHPQVTSICHTFWILDEPLLEASSIHSITTALVITSQPTSTPKFYSRVNGYHMKSNGGHHAQWV